MIGEAMSSSPSTRSETGTSSSLPVAEETERSITASTVRATPDPGPAPLPSSAGAEGP